MNANTQKLHDPGQSLWVDTISREMLIKGQLSRYIDGFSITGLTSNPTIFEHAIGHGNFYDDAIADAARRSDSAEELFFSLALEDLTKALIERYRCQRSAEPPSTHAPWSNNAHPH